MPQGIFYSLLQKVFSFPFSKFAQQVRSDFLLCSVSSLLTTTEAVVVELPKDEKEAPAMGGGMGGMDY